jgi:pimeloyl-ACP methyl ester carboxylesterase
LLTPKKKPTSDVPLPIKKMSRILKRRQSSGDVKVGEWTMPDALPSSAPSAGKPPENKPSVNNAAGTSAPATRAVAGRVVDAMRQEEVWCISKHSFHRIAYTEWGDVASDRVVLCVHGLTRQGRDYDPLAAALAEEGYRVICPDLVGRGQSGRLEDPDDYALPQYCSDMTTLIARLNVSRVDWVGTSLGALIGMIMAGLDHSPVERLVVNDIGPFLPWAALYRLGSYLRQMPTSFADLAAAEAYFREILAPFGELGDEDWLHLTRHSVAQAGDGSFRMLCDPGIARAFRPGLFYNLSLWRYWDAIACPTLVLRGEQSDMLLAETAAEMARRGPKAKVVEIVGCGHAPPLLDEDQIGIVKEWIDQGHGL